MYGDDDVDALVLVQESSTMVQRGGVVGYPSLRPDQAGLIILALRRRLPALSLSLVSFVALQQLLYKPIHSSALTMSGDSVQLSDAEWKAKLSKEQYQILRNKGTERAFTGKFYKNKDTGIYECGGCNAALFSSDTKFDSGSGWPSFWDPINDKAVRVNVDRSHGMVREEVVCARCGGHLGHVFDDGPHDKTGKRYCINSVSLDFKAKQ